MNQEKTKNSLKILFERRFFDVVNVLSNQLFIPSEFLRIPAYPGIEAIINNQRILTFNFVGVPLRGVDGSGSFISREENEAACFVPYGAKGLEIKISTAKLEEEAGEAHIASDCLFEILALHEMVHIAMMGGLAQSDPLNEWIKNTDYRYIHEAVALKACEFGFDDLFKLASRDDVVKYLAYVEKASRVRADGRHYLPYFNTYQSLPLDQFWDTLRKSQPSPGIFEKVLQIP